MEGSGSARDDSGDIDDVSTALDEAPRADLRGGTSAASPDRDQALQSFIVECALSGCDGPTLVEGVAERLSRRPFGLRRLAVAWRTLHPLVRAEDVVWTSEGGVEPGQFLHAQHQTSAYLDSPVRLVVENEIMFYRHSLTEDDLPFPMFEALAQKGHTEYVALLSKFGLEPIDIGVARGMFFSATTDAQGGFSDEAILTLRTIVPTLALAFRGLIERRMSQAVANTYLGRQASARVLSGAIRRGDAETVPAVVWYSDMRGFTPLSEALALDDTIAFLNETFEATAGAVDHAGGDVLDFIGDAVLAIFPLADDGLARALAALDEALHRLDGLRGRIAREPSHPALRASVERGLVGIALAVGNVRFGNIGTAARLAYSVIGPTVNQVARIEAMTKVLATPTLVTAEVAAAAPGRFRSVGVQRLQGIDEPVELYALLDAARGSTPP